MLMEASVGDASSVSSRPRYIKVDTRPRAAESIGGLASNSVSNPNQPGSGTRRDKRTIPVIVPDRFDTTSKAPEVFSSALALFPKPITQWAKTIRTMLRDNIVHDLSVDIGKAEITPCVAVGELFVVESQEMEHGGVEVVDVDAVFDSLESEFVCCAMYVAAFHSPSR